MKILHFCSYFIGSKVYKELFQEIDKHGIQQDIFVPVRNSSHKGVNNFKSNFAQVSYINILSFVTKLSYLIKIFMTIFGVLITQGRNRYNVIHAHTLYSDGIPAYIYTLLFGGSL
ncbi:hypothetical protein RT723_16560 [Psychrosphaera aquimarina]|uniref:Glycosyltransferase subfamily 4-like N-terminal domain-containing protein n=1 Tax=Psychrosphaera aquimarina TaxID=2044854 RepID=A0ABU3R4F0_9GAMM|nr:hypothetical protein [Psychrosphaera aquimarina]MDU0114572.1 hypothetical protein [Psychrosphaera aquimarina]